MNSCDAYYLTLKTGISNLALEKIISKDCYNSYYYTYAINVLKGRFKLGELIIIQDKNHLYSLDYCYGIMGYDHE